MIYDQTEYDIACEWSAEGISTLAPTADVVIVIDVLTFTTCVEFAVNQGAIVYPYRWMDETVNAFAESVNAEVADPNNPHGFNLSIVSLRNLPANARLVLPSPNGATVSLLETMKNCVSGREKTARGEEPDIHLAAEINASDCVPILEGGAFVKET